MVGAAALVTGGAMAALFTANAIGTLDRERTLKVEPVHQHGAWHTCGWVPLANAPVEVTLADGSTLIARTDSHGRAYVALGSAGSAGSADSAGSAGSADSAEATAVADAETAPERVLR
jgi:hypothetical protein